MYDAEAEEEALNARATTPTEDAETAAAAAEAQTPTDSPSGDAEGQEGQQSGQPAELDPDPDAGGDQLAVRDPDAVLTGAADNLAKMFGPNDPLAAALRRAGVDLSQVAVPAPDTIQTFSLDQLCTVESGWKDADFETPVLVVLTFKEFPEAQKFEGYQGYIWAECIDENGNDLAFTHYLATAQGELSPVAQFLRAAPAPPKAIKVAKIATSNPGRFVYRPIPITAGA